MIFFLAVRTALLFSFVRGARTIVPCIPGHCNITSLPRTGNERILGARVSTDFSGYVDLRSNSLGTVFSAQLKLLGGQAWPRISEGVAIPDATARGYPVSLTDYFTNDALYIKYRAEWRRRTSGKAPFASKATGTLQNGAFMYLNAPENRQEGTKLPEWPFTAEINIWNRYDGFTLEHPQVCNYTDADGVYSVHSGTEKRDRNKTMRIYYVLNQSIKDNNNNNASMNINNVKLLKHLVSRCQLTEKLDILEVSVIAKAVGAGSEGNFYAEIESMGRIHDPDSSAAVNGNITKNENGNNQGDNLDSGAKWEIIGSIIGAIATLIAAILTVYLSQGKCRRRRKENMNNHNHLDHIYDEAGGVDTHGQQRFEYI